jgi:RNA polymerase sigma factor (sigma-70 family)
VKRLTDEQAGFVAKNRWLAVKFARDWSRGRFQFDERLSLALEGLCYAAIGFDPDKGAFSTYAQYWMDQVLRRAIRVDFLIHVPDYINYKSDSDPRYAERRGQANRARLVGPLPAAFDRTYSTPDDGDPDEFATTRRAMEALDGRTREVIEATVMRRETLRSVGDRHGVSCERIRQIKQEGLAILREMLA